MTTPRIAIIGGSGLGNALLERAQGTPVKVETPFGPPSADPILMDWSGVPIVFLARHGVGHVFNPSQVPYRANIYALKSLGCQWILASGACGSLQQEISPRDLVVPDQIIDKTYRRVSSFFDHADADPAAGGGGRGGGVVHIEFADPFCSRLREILLDTSESVDLIAARVHSAGTYVCMEGPAFSTRAESLLHRSWGAHLIGMTAMPEARLAREAEISYAMVALATDYDCWKPHEAGPSKQALLSEIIGHLHAATSNALKLIEAAIPHIWAARTQDFPAHRALELAIWSDKSRIPAAEKARLELLWGKYVT
jgi:5'-methylthioadenosine phosphorylase